MNFGNKTPLFFFLFASPFLGCDVNPFSSEHPGDGNSSSVARESLNLEIDATGQTGLTLEGVSGTIRITGSPEAGSVLITGERRVGSWSYEDAVTRLADLEVQVHDQGEEIYVRTLQPSDSHGRNYVVDYTITVPRDFDLRIHNVSGTVDLRGTHGNVFTEVVSGTVDVAAILPMNGTVEITTVSGNVDLSLPTETSAEFSANVVSGNISVSNLSLRNQVKGRDSLRGTFGNGQGSVFLRTTSGNIAVRGR
jgi:hypothetical protein